MTIGKQLYRSFGAILLTLLCLLIVDVGAILKARSANAEVTDTLKDFRATEAVRYQISRLWYRTLCRRSQRHRLTPERMRRLVKKWLPLPRIVHSYPDFHLYVSTQGKSPVR